MPFVGHLPELMVVLVIGLLFFGPKRLPEMGNAVGKTIKEFQRSIKSIAEPDAKEVPVTSSVPTALTSAPTALPSAVESTPATVVHPLSTTETIVEVPTHAA